jgi:hypothetical protein
MPRMPDMTRFYIVLNEYDFNLIKFASPRYMGWDSTVGIATVRGSNLVGGEISRTRPNRPWAHPVSYTSVSQPPGRGPVPGPGINYTGPREVNIL